MSSTAAQPAVVSDRASSQPPTACTHYWVIEPAVGDESNGTCRRCGSRRSFTNRYREPELPAGRRLRDQERTAILRAP